LPSDELTFDLDSKSVQIEIRLALKSQNVFSTKATLNKLLASLKANGDKIYGRRYEQVDEDG
jgi:hypothetical protein